MEPASLAPVLVFGWGNLSRGDDALGPLCVESLRASAEPGAGVEFLDDYQLQIEHALDLVGRARVLFVDASLSCCAPFEISDLHAEPDVSLGTHALSPTALLHVFWELQGEPAPPSTLLAIRGDRFQLGEPLSEAARSNLLQALAWCRAWLRSS